MAWLGASTLLFILGLAVIRWIHDQYHMDVVVRPASPPAEPPLISICIPARDEQGNIRGCLEAALAQDYPNLEVIALDDRSTDSTLSQMRALASHDGRLIALEGTDLPHGWAGKPHALHQAAAVARGEWLCFVDADTRLSPQALSSCYAKALETGAGLFTTMNRQVLGSFWEKVVMPLILSALSVGFPPRRVNDPQRRVAVANGQFILIRREVYLSIGGHAGVRDQIVEDKALAERVKWSGQRLVLADGSQFIRTRMYTSLAGMWEGWTKNIYLGLHAHPFTLALGVFGAMLALMAAVVLPAWPVLGSVVFLRDGSWMAIAIILEAVILWGYLIFERTRVARRLEISGWYAAATPLGAGIFAAMMLASAWKVLSGRGVTWRGRKYPMRKEERHP
jgi:chlorobactene glucosyltransferase